MRLIDADVLKQHIDKLPALPDGNFAGSHSNLKALINMQPTIEPSTNCSETPNNWIPCSERLPETHKAGDSFSGIFMQSKPVLVYGVPEYESEYSFNVVTYCDDLNGITYWSTEMDAVTINEVTAWMPLPAPYKEDEKCQK